MMTDITKRNTLKKLAATGIGTAAVTLAPAAVALSKSSTHVSTNSSHVPYSGISLTHFRNPNGQTLLLTNETDQVITLKELSPGYLETAEGDLDLQGLFKSGHIVVPANGTQAFSIIRNGDTVRYASWGHVAEASRKAQTTGGTQFVSVVNRYGESSHDVMKLYTAEVAVS